MSLSPLFADISSNNEPPDFTEYSRNGHILVAIKATEGVSYVNPDHRAWCYGAQVHRIAVIHYHFARPDLGNKASDEADRFLEVALPLAAGRDYLALDLERGTPDGWSHDPAWSHEFDTRVRAKSRFHTILYASRATLASGTGWLMGPPARVWDADWSEDPDYAPNGMTVAIRQQSGVTSGVPPYGLPGIGACDVDGARGLFWHAAVRNYH